MSFFLVYLLEVLPDDMVAKAPRIKAIWFALLLPSSSRNQIRYK
jgi:hypothetical protein